MMRRRPSRRRGGRGRDCRPRLRPADTYSFRFAQSGLTLDDWHQLVRWLAAASSAAQSAAAAAVVMFDAVAHRGEKTEIGRRCGHRSRRRRRIASTAVRPEGIRRCRRPVAQMRMMVVILTGQAQSHDRWLETSKIRRVHSSSSLQHPNWFLPPHFVCGTKKERKKCPFLK